MSPKRQRPGPAETAEATRRLLVGLARGDDAGDLAQDAFDLHPRDDTFPGEVYLRLGAEALAICGVSPDHPIPQEGLLAEHLPESVFKGRQNAKVRFAVLATAAVAGGLEVDLLDEVAWWGGDDYWDYALCATVALIRAAAAQAGGPVGELVAELARRHGIDLGGAGGELTPEEQRPAKLRPLS